MSMMQSTNSFFGFKVTVIFRENLLNLTVGLSFVQVVGGKTTSAGRLGAFITKVKKGSLADTVGHLRIGDEVVSWNDRCLQDATYEEVKYIIQSSQHSPTVREILIFFEQSNSMCDMAYSAVPYYTFLETIGALVRSRK